MKNKLFKGLSLSANPKHLIKDTFSAVTKVFTEFFEKISKQETNLTNITLKGLDVVRQHASKFFKTAESGVDKVFSSCEKNPSVHWRYMNFLRQRKTALAAPLYEVSAGRSMIEMLGVLAIIGVLSVGGIAGYSKAMMMWRSNVQRQMLTELISGVIRLQSNLPPDIGDDPEIDLTPILGAMGLLPEGTKYEDDWIQDKYGVKAQVGYSYIYGNIYFIRLYYVPTEGEGISPYQELCRNVVQVTKPLADKIDQLRSWKTESENSSYSIIYYGKDLATETVEETNRKCKNVAFGVHMTIVFKF